MSQVIVLGAGGHAAVVVDLIRACGHDPIALVDPDPRDAVLGVPVHREIPRLEAMHFAIGFGGIGQPHIRQRIEQQGLDAGLDPLTLVHPGSNVAAEAQLGPGTTVMAGAVLAPRARLGRQVIVNHLALVEHDAEIGDYSHIAPGARVLGACKIGEGAHIGAGAIVLQGVEIGANAIIGAGAVVLRNVAPGATMVGNPAREIVREDSSSGK